MANTRGSVNLRSSASKQSFLPPKSPFPIIPPSYADHGCSGSKGNLKQRGHTHHQRTSSESFLIEEQPSWLDDLLNEPETPTKRGSHRRSSSDSFTFMDGASMYSNFDKTRQKDHRQRGITSLPPWGAQGFDHLKDAQHVQYHPGANFFGRSPNRGLESPLNLTSFRPNTAPVVKEKIAHHGSLCVLRNPDAVKSDITEKEQEGSPQDLNAVSERMEDKQLQSEVDAKRAKQQFAQRSRVRKLQYIAELERNVQALQAEGLEVSADIEFLSQQNVILDLENKTLKQRLESIAQEQLIKHFQQEMFEREIGRLRSLYQQQQQQQQQPAVTHNRSSSRDLDSQFAGLSLKLKHPNTGGDPVTGVLRI